MGAKSQQLGQLTHFIYYESLFLCITYVSQIKRYQISADYF